MKDRYTQMKTTLTEAEYIVLWSFWGRGRAKTTWTDSSLRLVLSKEKYDIALRDLVSANIIRSLPDGTYAIADKARRAMTRNEFIKQPAWDGSAIDEWNV